MTLQVVSRITMPLVDDHIAELTDKKFTTDCARVRKILDELGFDVRKTGGGNHYVFQHSGLPDFMGGSFDCGHGKNPDLKPKYIDKIIKLFAKYIDELRLRG